MITQRLAYYSLTKQRYSEMLAEQDNRCTVCKETFTKCPHIDHDHACCSGFGSCGGCIRGLLCSPCNRALGLFKDNPATVEAAASYLRTYMANKPMTVRQVAEQMQVSQALVIRHFENLDGVFTVDVLGDKVLRIPPSVYHRYLDSIRVGYEVFV